MMTLKVLKKYSKKLETFFSVEYLRVFLVSLFIVGLYYLPNIIAQLNVPDGKVYAGQAEWFDPWDINVYISAIKWAQEHGLYFQNQYTTIAHPSVIFYPFYTLLGAIFPNINQFFLYDSFRLIVGFIFITSIYYVVKLFLTKQRMIALMTIPLAGGFGALFYPTLQLPDISMPPFTLASAFQRPHEMFAMTCYFFSLAFFYKAVTHKAKNNYLLSAVFQIPVLFFYPFYLLSYYLICFTYLVFVLKKPDMVISSLISIICVTLPLGFFASARLLTSNSFENVLSPGVPTPPLPYLILGYGILLPIFIFDIIKNKTTEKKLFLYIWLFLSILLTYSPLSFSRYYLRGLFVPAIILFFILAQNVKWKNQYLKKVFLYLTLVMFLSTNFTIVLARISISLQGENSWYFISNNSYKIMITLDNLESNSRTGVIALYPLSNQIPAFTDKRVYHGHTLQTPQANKKRSSINQIYSNEIDKNEMKRFAVKNNVCYIVWEEEYIPNFLNYQEAKNYQSIKKPFLYNICDEKIVYE